MSNQRKIGWALVAANVAAAVMNVVIAVTVDGGLPPWVNLAIVPLSIGAAVFAWRTYIGGRS